MTGRVSGTLTGGFVSVGHPRNNDTNAQPGDNTARASRTAVFIGEHPQPLDDDSTSLAMFLMQTGLGAGQTHGRQTPSGVRDESRVLA